MITYHSARSRRTGSLTSCPQPDRHRFRSQQRAHSQPTAASDAVDGRKFDRLSESKKKKKERTKLWRPLHIECHLHRHARRLRCYPEAAPNDRTFPSCKTIQVRHVARISSRNIWEKPNLDLLSSSTAKWTACTLQRYSIPHLPHFDFFFRVLTFPVSGLSFVHFFRCFPFP